LISIVFYFIFRFREDDFHFFEGIKSANDITECDEYESFSEREKIKNFKCCDDRLSGNYVKL